MKAQPTIKGQPLRSQFPGVELAAEAHRQAPGFFSFAVQGGDGQMRSTGATQPAFMLRGVTEVLSHDSIAGAVCATLVLRLVPLYLALASDTFFWNTARSDATA